MVYGTLHTLDTLAASNQTVAQFGEDNAFRAVDLAFQAHNRIVNDLLGSLVETTTDRLRRYGGVEQMQMDEIDQFAQPDAQKIGPGQNVGFPMRLYGASVQWTRKYFQVTTAAEFAAQITAIMDADVRIVTREIKRALFRPTNLTFNDRLIDNVELPVKALLNADNEPIPFGPNGESFDASTHTHYLGRAGGSLAESDVAALIEHVIEHFGAGTVMLAINRANEADVRAFDGFQPYLDPRIIPGNASDHARGTLDVMQINNRAIGILDGAEVWVKPWVPANYYVAWVEGVEAPLARRVRSAGGGNLELVADDEKYPLRARSYEREFGIGVQNRAAAAVLYGGDTSYAAPSL